MKKEKMSISGILEKPWATKMLSMYSSKKEAIRWNEFRTEIKINNKILDERLSALCDVGLLIRTERGKYVRSPFMTLNYVFKCQDIKLIQDCSVDLMYTLGVPYEKLEAEVHVLARNATVYGLSKRCKDVDDIISAPTEKLYRYFTNRYKKKLKDIIANECDKIEDKQLVKAIKKWHSQAAKNINAFLLPSRGWKEIPPIPISPGSSEVKEITERIWKQFCRESSPTCIVLRF